jgi:hypothetical protein
MSANDPKRTSPSALHMSAFGADSTMASQMSAIGHKADIACVDLKVNGR